MITAEQFSETEKAAMARPDVEMTPEEAAAELTARGYGTLPMARHAMGGLMLMLCQHAVAIKRLRARVEQLEKGGKT